jgi:hypothetical protein
MGNLNSDPIRADPLWRYHTLRFDCWITAAMIDVLFWLCSLTSCTVERHQIPSERPHSPSYLTFEFQIWKPLMKLTRTSTVDISSAVYTDGRHQTLTATFTFLLGIWVWSWWYISTKVSRWGKGQDRLLLDLTDSQVHEIAISRRANSPTQAYACFKMQFLSSNYTVYVQP